ncbi:MAG: hypothetical protein ACRELB_21330, partial [Polyangiaceae bacterium]
MAEGAAAWVLHRERRTLRALVRAERRTQGLARAAVTAPIERAAGSVAHTSGADQERVALAAIRRAAPLVQKALEGALLEARG